MQLNSIQSTSCFDTIFLHNHSRQVNLIVSTQVKLQFQEKSEFVSFDSSEFVLLQFKFHLIHNAMIRNSTEIQFDSTFIQFGSCFQFSAVCIPSPNWHLNVSIFMYDVVSCEFIECHKHPTVGKCQLKIEMIQFSNFNWMSNGILSCNLNVFLCNCKSLQFDLKQKISI